jgi:hypothetical protein
MRVKRFIPPSTVGRSRKVALSTLSCETGSQLRDEVCSAGNRLTRRPPVPWNGSKSSDCRKNFFYHGVDFGKSADIPLGRYGNLWLPITDSEEAL